MKRLLLVVGLVLLVIFANVLHNKTNSMGCGLEPETACKEVKAVIQSIEQINREVEAKSVITEQ